MSKRRKGEERKGQQENEKKRNRNRDHGNNIVESKRMGVGEIVNVKF